MAIRKRRTSSGTTEEYHYEFMQSGKRYYGVCEGCTTEREAHAYEKELREKTKILAKQKNVKSLVINFRDELTGGEAITIQEAYLCSLKKPKRKMPSQSLIRQKQAYWNDFSTFMGKKIPDVVTLANVRREHAEAYIHYLGEHGRFNKHVEYVRKGTTATAYVLKGKLSQKTINTYLMTLSEVFQLLEHDAGIIENPFSGIPKMPKEAETREAFTEEELKLIGENLEDFTRPLFTIAIATALREGDICTLLWAEVDFKNAMILRQRMRKTGHPVEIPIMPPLMDYLHQLNAASKKRPEDEFSKYVLPEHAKMYLTNSSGVSYRIKQFLEDTCKIKTTRIPEGRSRAVSVKDLHSCRHTFCYYAGLHGIPLPIVQSIVGHMTPEMTAHYSAHASREMKREKMAQMPALLKTSAKHLLSGNVGSENSESARNELKRLADILPEKIIKDLLAIAKKEHGVYADE